jgi:hypothetical protein
MQGLHRPTALLGRGLLTLFAGIAGTGWAVADPIYIQPPAPTLAGIASQHDPTNVLPFQYKAFDDFMLTASASISHVTWFGSYSESIHDPVVDTLIEFWSDDSGLPGDLLVSYRIQGDASERFIQSDQLFTAFDYGTDLAIPFTASANTKYWMSIQLNVAFPPQWFWRDGLGGDDRSAEITGSVSDTPAPISHDRAFALYSSTPAPIPEPSALALTTTGVAALILRRRRIAKSRSSRSV